MNISLFYKQRGLNALNGSAGSEETIEIKEPNLIVFRGVGKPKEIELPTEVVEWLRYSTSLKLVLREIVNHYRFRLRLAHPGAIRSLLLLLYARARGEPPYKVAKRFNVAPEQLYRLERGLKKDGLYEYVMNALSLET
jgi:hypothetical protein